MRRALSTVLVAMIVVACGNDPATTTTADATTTTTTVPETTSTAVATTTSTGLASTTALAADVTVVGGQVEGPDLFEFALGDQVEITLLIDVADEIHVHGLDHRFAAAPGVPVEISFEADAPGIFEVELEASHLPLFEIQVTP